MVWHAYQLNPRDFFEDCLRFGKMKFWRAGLPWPVINSCINNETFEFTPSNEAVKYFENRTGFSWDSRVDPSEAQIKCHNCNKLHTIPWTKWDSKSSWQMETYPKSLKGEHEATGFADKNFSFTSPCGTWIDHEFLKMQKFRKDMEALRFNDVPMPGTLLDIKGM